MLIAIIIFAVLFFAIALCGANDYSEPQNVNRCVICGRIIPEGTQFCPQCERKINNGK